MTGPMPQGLDPEILANIEKLKKARMESDIPTYLREVAQVDPAQYGYGAPPGRSLGQQFMHGAGLIGRMAVQGAGNLASIPYGLAGAAYQGVTGNQPPALLQGNQGTAAADQLGLPQPQGAGERILTAGGENAVMSGILPGAGPGLAALGAGAGMAGQGAAEMGASSMGQMAASAAVGMGLPVVGAMGASVIRSALAGSASRREVARQSMALLQAGNPTPPQTLMGALTGQGPAGGPVTLGQVTERALPKLAEGGLKNSVGASERLRNTWVDQGEALGAKATRIADQISPGGTPTSAGAMIQKGISEGFVPQFRATSKALYDKVYQLVPPETPVIPAYTTGLFGQMSMLQKAARPLDDNLFMSPQIQKWSEGMAAYIEQHPEGVPFNVLKEWRSRIGEAMSGSDLIEGVGMRDLKRLYGTLSDDMRGAVASRGPAAERAWDRAQTHWQAGTDRLERVLQPLMDKRSPELAFNAAMSGTKDGATLLRSTMRSLAPVEKRLVASTVLRRMGGDNEFLPGTYFRNWKKLSPEAKATLFEGNDQNIPKDLNRLAQAMELRENAGKTLFNPAGTAVATSFNAIMKGVPITVAGVAMGNMPLAALGAAPAAGAVGANIMSRALTNPRLIRWLVQQTAIPAGALKQQAVILAKDSEKWDPESRDIGQELSQAITGIDWPKMIMATALADQAH